MAQINLNDVYTGGDNATSNNQVGFFNLQNDGDEAIVRFMVDSVEDMEILTVHDIRLDGKFRQISCVRDPREPIDKCPLCARDEKVKQVVFIKMIQYVQTPNGIEAKPVVWQRNASTYAYRIKGYLDNYGPLSNILCKVIRHGAHGDLKTTYDIIPNLSPAQFPQENFPVDYEVFKDYKACGRVVLDKTVDEINTFIATGSFPETGGQNTTYTTGTPITPQPYPPQSSTATPVPVQTVTPVPVEHSTTPMNNTPPTGGMQRPTRYY